MNFIIELNTIRLNLYVYLPLIPKIFLKTFCTSSMFLTPATLQRVSTISERPVDVDTSVIKYQNKQKCVMQDSKIYFKCCWVKVENNLNSNPGGFASVSVFNLVKNCTTRALSFVLHVFNWMNTFLMSIFNFWLNLFIRYR